MEHTIVAVPVELWDLIFHHLDGDSLLTFAVVCRGFNELAITMYLLRQGVSAISIHAGNLDVFCDDLSALQLSCPLLPLKRLRCTFSGSRLSWKLGLLQNIISQTPSMQELHLELPEEFTSYGAHAALHGVLYAACSKVQGPVLVVYGGELLKYTVQDVSGRQLPQISANVGPALAPRWLHPFFVAGRRMEAGAPRFSSVSIWSVPLADKPLGPCTILVPESPIRSLWLGGKGRSQVESFSSAEISAIPHLTFPHLEKLNIETNCIDPVALGAFLMRHPKITKISYEPRKSTFDFLHWGQIPPLISPSIAHPGLEKIFVRRMADLIPLLDGLSTSPLLSRITFPYIRNSTSSVAMLKAILHHIATQPAASLYLCLCIEGRNTRPLDAEEKALARALTTLRHLDIRSGLVEESRLRGMNGRSLYRWILPLMKEKRSLISYTRGHSTKLSFESQMNREANHYASKSRGHINRMLSALVPTFTMDDYTFHRDGDGWIESNSVRSFIEFFLAAEMARKFIAYDDMDS